MEIKYYKDYSLSMGRDMEVKTWGHAGFPVLFIPCQDGRFYDFENYRMVDTMAPWIESGQITVYSIDTVDRETWSDPHADPRKKAELYERWLTFICDELVPFAGGKMMVMGCSLGATHAAILYYRCPDLFTKLLAISGIYTSTFGFGDYHDDLTYFYSPIDFLANMPADHPYIELYNQGKSVLCSGQGAWEMPEYTKRMKQILESKGIHTWVDLWGYDVNHDWPWWYKMVDYFMHYLFS
ncbi:MAG: alpha/beta hydrolase-fold protein [Eubacteriales bacterium]|nr:alpha/beta hydrolase-fold protein [Eubacteriales bacterium]